MEQNNQAEKNNTEIKLNGEGEPVRSGSKKYLGKKIVVLILFLSIMVIAGYAYFLFLGGKDDNQLPKENIEIVKDEEAREAEIDKQLDSDQDRLPDYFEKILGTAVDNPDTDGDSYSDFDEIKNGYNPLTSEKYSVEEWEVVKGKIKAADEGFYEKEFGSVDVNSGFTCGTSTVNDIDGNTYNTVSIGSQCWLKQNLRTGVKILGSASAANNGIVEKYCYNDTDTNCATDGGLYQWNEAMGYITTAGAQGICPTGWHIPTDAQQYALENYLKDGANSCVSARTGWDCDTAGTKLKVGGASGFEGILAGDRYPDGSFHTRLAYTYFWSSSQCGASYAWKRSLYSGFSAVARYYHNKAFGFSVRCLKD